MHSTVRAASLGSLVAVLMSGSALAVPVSGDPVLYWAEQLIASQAGSPLTGSRGVAMIGAALYDAVSYSRGDADHAFINGLSTPGGNTRAAASVAAHDLLVKLFPARAAIYGAALTDQLALIPDGDAKTRGIATGALVADAIWTKRDGDGSAAVVPYTPSGLPGRWAPTPPASAPFAFTQWGSQDTWLIASGDQFRPAAPPSLDSAEYAAAFAMVQELGSATSATRTMDQTNAAQYWATTPGNPMLRLALSLAEGKGLSTAENAQLFALIATATADSGITAWDAKLHYDFWRPITGIRNADLDGNDATVADPAWTSLLTNPPYPAYTSGLVSVVTPGATILEWFFGDDLGICLPHGTNPALDRCWADFDAMVLEAAYSRIWGGIHWEFDQLAAIDMARALTNFILDGRAFERIPEPAALALFGFGAGALMIARNRRRRQPH
jgi:PAP2 superfamily/PEP-CTERM motif